jgi:hypothetical protein
MKLGFILASCYFAGAIATELSHNALKVNPFIPIVLLWIGAFIRDRSIFFWYKFTEMSDVTPVFPTAGNQG